MILFGAEKRKRRKTASVLYEACLEASRNPVLYMSYGVPDTLQGRFEMLSLHLFPLLHRLMHDPGDDPELARSISEAFVIDMDAAFREMGVGDVTVPKRMKTLYRSFGGRISAYKAGLEKGPEQLAAVVARNVFPDQPVDNRSERLAGYLSGMIEAFRSLPFSQLVQGGLPFTRPDLKASPGSQT